MRNRERDGRGRTEGRASHEHEQRGNEDARFSHHGTDYGMPWASGYGGTHADDRAHGGWRPDDRRHHQQGDQWGSAYGQGAYGGQGRSYGAGSGGQGNWRGPGNQSSQLRGGRQDHRQDRWQDHRQDHWQDQTHDRPYTHSGEGHGGRGEWYEGRHHDDQRLATRPWEEIQGSGYGGGHFPGGGPSYARSSYGGGDSFAGHFEGSPRGSYGPGVQSGWGASSDYGRPGQQGGPWGAASSWSGQRGRGPRGYQRSDERIREDLCEAVINAGIDASEVDIRVDSAEVTLAGTVTSKQEKRRIEDIAESISGVKDVHNQIRLSQGSSQQRSHEQQQAGAAPPSAAAGGGNYIPSSTSTSTAERDRDQKRNGIAGSAGAGNSGQSNSPATNR
jgi:hypothetical protein